MLSVTSGVSAAACVFLIVVLVREGPAASGLWAAPVAAVAGVVAAAAAVWAVAPRSRKVPLPPELEVPDWVIDRPAELAAVVRSLAGRAGTVGITTGLYGAGGFGKTTLAQIACADRRVRRRFGGRVFLVTVGRDLRGAAAISAKVNDVIKLVAGEDATFTDPELAGRRLGSLLDAGPRRLLVLDDVWEPEQLTPFAEGGKRCARLITTRVPELLTGQSMAVQVDQMSPEQARVLLTSGLPPLDSAVIEGLLAVTGRWPLLLRLVSKILADYARVAADVPAQGAALLERIRTGGPAVVDRLLSEADPTLDVGRPEKRAKAVRATIEASTSLLDHDDAERFAELAVFAENEIIPFSLVAELWRATAALSNLQAARICMRLAQLALVSQPIGPDHGLTLHDVLRDYLRAELGQQKLTDLNDRLLDAVATNLPAVGPLNPERQCPVRIAWWDLSHEDRYLWDHLIEHLIDADRPGDAEALAGDLRWVGARLEQSGPAAPTADLSAAGTPQTLRLRAVLARTAHLLAPTDPAGAVVDILHSRVADDQDWGRQVIALSDTYRRMRLVNRWPLPDLANPSLRRVLPGHTGPVWAVELAPDCSWLASGGRERTLWIWDLTTGRERSVLTGHTDGVMAVAVSPDGSWLASGSWDETVRIWDTATGQQRAVLVGHTGVVTAVAVSPDGSWLASGSWDETVRIWDTATGQQRAVLTGHNEWVTAVAVSPDGSWLASGSTDETVRIWDAVTCRQRAVLTGRTGGVAAVAVSPDSSWLASGGTDGAVRIWDAGTGKQRTVLKGHAGEVAAVAVSPDSSWLASGSTDGAVRIWDVATGQQRTVLKGHVGGVTALAVAPVGSALASGGWDGAVRIWDVDGEQAGWTGSTGEMEAVPSDRTNLASPSINRTVRTPDPAIGQQNADRKGRGSQMIAVTTAPDGSWLASGSDDGAVRIWDAATNQQRAILKGHGGPVRAVTVAPDGSWLASGGVDGRLASGIWDGAVRIWDAATGQQRAILTGHGGEVAAVAVSPDGSWLASGSWDGAVRIWDVATGQQRFSLKGRSGGVTAVAVSPDGSWLASGSTDGAVRIWDIATGQQRFSLKGRGGGVTAVAVSPDGSWLASGSWDGAVRIWDVATGQQRFILKGHTDWITAVAMAPDGMWLGSVGGDGAVRIWDTSIGRACALMRLDYGVTDCAWLGLDALAVAGPAGLYLFGITDTGLARAKH